MSAPPVPNFGEMLAPIIGRVPAAAMPRFLAMLERTAADRYRSWALAWPAHGEVLLACAAREDEIADLIEAAFECDDDTLAAMRALLPEARDLYYAAFDGFSVAEQLHLQAAAELQGAAAWQGIAGRLPPASEHVVAVLARCSALERHSSVAVQELLAADVSERR
jgi:hypothetical protein